MNGSEEQEDHPSLGEIRGGRVLVGQGDDRLEQLVDWLGSMVSEFEGLKDLAEGEEEDPAYEECAHSDRMTEFLDELGIHVNTEFWEGGMISGHFKTAWVNESDLRAVQNKGKGILRHLRRHARNQIRIRAIEKLKRITSLEEIIDQTAGDRRELMTRIDQLEAALKSAEEKLSGLRKDAAFIAESTRDLKRIAELKQEALEATAESVKAKETSALSLECIRFLCAVLRAGGEIKMSGPLVLWSDGVTYAITHQGASSWPADDPFRLLLGELRKAGRPVVEVQEKVERVFLGSSGSRHHYQEIPDGVGSWDRVWRKRRGGKREFVVDDPAHLKVVEAIWRHIRGSTFPP